MNNGRTRGGATLPCQTLHCSLLGVSEEDTWIYASVSPLGSTFRMLGGTRTSTNCSAPSRKVLGAAWIYANMLFTSNHQEDPRQQQVQHGKDNPLYLSAVVPQWPSAFEWLYRGLRHVGRSIRADPAWSGHRLAYYSMLVDSRRMPA